MAQRTKWNQSCIVSLARFDFRSPVSDLEASESGIEIRISRCRRLSLIAIHADGLR
jgi:hypothetical protein